MNEVIHIYTIQFWGALGCEVQGFFRLFQRVFPTIYYYLSIEVQKELVRSKNFLYILYVR